MKTVAMFSNQVLLVNEVVPETLRSCPLPAKAVTPVLPPVPGFAAALSTRGKYDGGLLSVFFSGARD